METIIKQSGRNYRIAEGRITLLDSRFYFREDGAPVPSITTLLDAYPKSAGFYEWLKKNGEDSDEIRDEAGRKGSTVHRLTEQYDKGEEITLLTDGGEVGFTMLEWAMLERYIDFVTRFDPTIIEIEQNMVGERFGGTKDRVIRLGGKRYNLDIKTGNAVYAHQWLQLAGYTALDIELGHPKPDGLAILWLNAKTKTEGRKDAIQGKGWQLLIAEKPWEDYYKIFEHVYALWMEENGSMIPRQVSYQLTHQKI
jgi:hypothetical protein